jgi:hypothetical protein
MTTDYEMSKVPIPCTHKDGHKWIQYSDGRLKMSTCIQCACRRFWNDDSNTTIIEYDWMAPNDFILNRLDELKQEREEIIAIIKAANKEDVSFALEIGQEARREMLFWTIVSESDRFNTGNLRHIPLKHVTTADNATIDVGPCCAVTAGKNCQIRVHSFSAITVGHKSTVYCRQDCRITAGDAHIFIRTSDPPPRL